MKLDLQLCVELFGRACFLFVDPFGPGIEPAKADFGAPELAAIEPHAAACKPAQKRPVVADDDECPGKSLQPFLEPFDCAQIEMVCRFIEKDMSGLVASALAIAARRRSPPLAVALATGKIDPKLVRDRRGLMGLRGILPIKHPVAKGLKASIWGPARGVRPCSQGQSCVSFIGIDQAGDAPQQRRLAGSVSPDECQSIPFADVRSSSTEQPAFPLDQSKIFIAENWGGHRSRTSQGTVTS